MRFLPAALLASVTVLQACSGRVPETVAALERPHVRYLNCPAIFAEVKANMQAISDLAREQSVKARRPTWIGKEWMGSESKDLQALQTRQEYLVTLAEHKNCGAPRPSPS